MIRFRTRTDTDKISKSRRTAMYQDDSASYQSDASNQQEAISTNKASNSFSSFIPRSTPQEKEEETAARLCRLSLLSGLDAQFISD